VSATGLWARLHGTGRTDRPGLRGVWRSLRARTDPAEFRPKLADDIEIREFRPRWGNDYAMICNPRDLTHYRVEPEELETVRLMDGTRTVKEIVVERFRGSGDLELDGVLALVRQLQHAGFLDPPFVNVENAVERAMGHHGLRAVLARFGKTLSIEWTGAERMVRWLYGAGLRWFFKPSMVVLAGVLSVAGLVAFVFVVREGRYSLTGQSLALEFLILIGLDFLITFFHELGHALVLVHHGRRVKSAGFEIYYASPTFFVDASDGLMLDRRQRIAQAAAGPLADMMVAGIGILLVVAFPGTALASVLYKFAVLNYFVTFMNLVPLLELDGYYILSDLIQVPDLRSRSLQFIRSELWHRIRNRMRLTRAQVGLALYGIVGVAFAVFSLYTGFFFWRQIFGSLIVRMWNGGFVTQLMLVALGILVAGPLLRGAVAALRSLARRIRALWAAARFRLEQSWRVEAAELIDGLPLFQDVPEDALNELAGRVRLRTLAPGQAVVRQGERADAFYVVRTGTLQVVEEDPESGAERPLRTIGRGESFGELGLLESAPRAATVRALDEAQVFEVDKGTFDRFLADMAEVPDFGPTLQAAAELRKLPPFATLQPSQLADLLEHGAWITVPPGETLIEQGEEGDSFYVVGSGQVEVLDDGRPVTTLGPGAHFGEVALLLDVPRTATVRARTPVRAFRLDREGFDRLVGDAFRRGTLFTHGLAERTQTH
jgi:CRP-like cAMP-binding protein/Zn-dependent protease